MILFEEAVAPAVKAGEFDLCGRRVAVRAIAYSADAAPPSFRFDALERRFVAGRRGATVAAGPADPQAWREALGRLAAGAVAVERCSSAEAVRGAYRAAAEGALAAGRGVYLLDPDQDALPPKAGPAVVVVASWRPGPLPPILAKAAASGFSSGLALPVIPGWTAEASFYEPLLDAAAAHGAVFVAPLSPASDGEARRLAVEARADEDPSTTDSFFERVHHAGWGDDVPKALAAMREAVVRRGLRTLPARPRGEGEPAANSSAAAGLEERAALPAAGEHLQALLHGAVRWIEESGRDLSAVVREGNFRKVFPFGPEAAQEVEAALRGQR